MGILVYSFLWVMQDVYHQPYFTNIGAEIMVIVFNQKRVAQFAQPLKLC